MNCPHSDSCFTCPLPDCKGSDWKVIYYNVLEMDVSQRRNRCGERSEYGDIPPATAEAAGEPTTD